MSEKKLKQSRLPFQILTSPKTPTGSAQSLEKSSISTSTPKTPLSTHPRKRKPSSEGENLRQSKIGRLTNAKENIAEPETIELIDSDDEKTKETPKAVETTPTTTESVIHIKLPSTTKSRRKLEVKVNPAKTSIEEAPGSPDDSIVYLDKEELPSKSAKKVKKSAKKAEKKRKSKAENDDVKRVMKNLDMNEETPENDAEDIETPKDDSEQQKDDETAQVDPESPQNDKVEDVIESSNKNEMEPMDIDEIPQPIESTVSDQISKLINASGTNCSPVKDIQEILSDDESALNQSLNTSLNSSLNQNSDVKKTPKVLTPKQQAYAKKLEEKRLEKELAKQKEREAKEALRLKEKEQREEAKRREKEEKEELRKKEKEEREKKKQAELEKKEEERRQKEEEKKKLIDQKEEEKRLKEEERKKQNEARDEEKRKKEAEKLKLEERKKKTAEAFTKFFVPKKKATTPMLDDEASKESAESADTVGKNQFMPFQVHGQMRLAPCVRYQLSSDELRKLDDIMSGEKAENVDYLKELKSGARHPKSSGKTWPQEDKMETEDDDDVIIIDELQGVGEDIKEDEAHLKMKHRSKFLSFTENRRPAYHGTWRKKSSKIYARRPFAQDPKFFDYEVDSDDEWEEEEPGESLHGSDSEKEKEANEEDYEVDNDFFVPHGHLSDDEVNQSADGAELEDNTPETQKAKLKILQQEFAAEMKKKTEKIKPRLIGCIWMNGDEDEDGGTMMDDLEKKYHCSDIIWRIMKARECWSSGEEIKMEDFEPELPQVEDVPNEKPSTAQQKTPAAQKVRPKLESDDSIKELIRLLHLNTNSKKYLIKEYQAYRLKNYHKNADFQEYSVKSVEEKMMEICVYKTCPDDGPLFGKKCWMVKPEIITQYFGDEQLPSSNQWSYILEKEVKEKKKPAGDNGKKGSREVTPDGNEKPANTEKQPEIAVKESPKPQSSAKPQASTSGKKRVQLLMSVPRGERFDENKKNNRISQFLTKGKSQAPPKEKVETHVDDNGVVEIID